jgi:hypothetical protein
MYVYGYAASNAESKSNLDTIITRLRGFSRNLAPGRPDLAMHLGTSSPTITTTTIRLVLLMPPFTLAIVVPIDTQRPHHGLSLLGVLPRSYESQPRLFLLGPRAGVDAHSRDGTQNAGEDLEVALRPRRLRGLARFRLGRDGWRVAVLGFQQESVGRLDAQLLVDLWQNAEICLVAICEKKRCISFVSIALAKESGRGERGM